MNIVALGPGVLGLQRTTRAPLDTGRMVLCARTAAC